jgi:hypothetical protein
MSLATHNTQLDAIAASLAEACPSRYVQRSLVDPGNETRERLEAGVVCLVTEGGGDFANYRGREGDMGTLNARLVGYVKVADDSAPEEVERAELALLGELLDWVATTAVPGIDTMLPGDWQQSKQMEHPYGWLVLSLEIKT